MNNDVDDARDRDKEDSEARDAAVTKKDVPEDVSERSRSEIGAGE